MNKFWTKRTIGIVGAILIIVALVNMFLLVGIITGLIDLNPQEEKAVEEEILPTTYLIEFGTEGSHSSINTDDVYFPGDTISVDVEVTEENTHGVVVWVVWSAVSPLGGVKIDCSPPNSEVKYTTMVEENEQYRNFHMALFGALIERPWDWDETYETEAFSLEEASIYANNTYSINSSIGTWSFTLTFQPGTLKYLIIGAETEVSSYFIYCREKVEEESSEE